MKTPAPMTISDREIALKLADLTADDKNGFGFAFYNASLVRFAIEIANWRDEQWRRANMSFAQLYPPNPDATCKCEHWQYCAECHPTAPQQGATEPTSAEGVEHG